MSGATWVRVFFLLTGFFGFGVVFYLGLWIALPMAPAPVESPGLEAASRLGRRPGRPTALRDAGPHIAFAVVLLGVVGLVDGNGGPSLLCGPPSSRSAASPCCGARPTRRSGSGGSTRPPGSTYDASWSGPGGGPPTPASPPDWACS